jgi:hypothetical protein
LKVFYNKKEKSISGVLNVNFGLIIGEGVPQLSADVAHNFAINVGKLVVLTENVTISPLILELK